MGAPPKWEFDAPYTAIFRDGMYGKWLELLANGFTVASFAVTDFGSEQACVEAAWSHAYGPSDDARIESLERQVSAAPDLLAALAFAEAHLAHCMAADAEPGATLCAALAKARGDT
jgi:hypothetical protein